jgi:hypothetical protein
MFSDESSNQQEKIENPVADQLDQPEQPKRNSGRTGATSSAGKYTCSRNATRHGMCATTLIMKHEDESAWEDLLATWLAQYNNPEEKTVLYTFVLKTAQAEWHRLRVQLQYDVHYSHHGAPPTTAWSAEEIKAHDLCQRYLTAAERRFHREYKMLEYHWKSHHKPAPEPRKTTKQPAPEPPQRVMPEIFFTNAETGESVDAKGNYYPPPADWTPKKIIPGVYEPDHPAYEPPREGRKL